MKKSTTAIILLVVLALSLSLMAGCTQTQTSTTGSAGGTTTTKATGGTTTTAGNEPAANLTYWVALNSNVAATAASYNDVPMFVELMKRTNVNVEFQHPPVGQENEQFNLMINSMELPDIIESNWIAYPGGPEKAVNDEVILSLNDILDDKAVYLKTYYQNNPNIDKLVKTDSGIYYSFPFIRGDAFLMVYGGAQMRQDWLDELDLEVPTTIDEWDSVLKATKESKNLDYALTFTVGNINSPTYGSLFLSTYGVLYSFFVDPSSNEIKYGPMQDGYKEALSLLARWYDEGVLDPDFASQDGTTYDAKITGGKTMAFFALTGSGLGRYTTTVRPENPEFTLVGVPWPTVNKGDTPIAGQKDHAYSGAASAAITSQCENVDAAVRFLDYHYSDEGHMLLNFGIEGESYTMVDGYPTYTDLIKKNPDGLSMAHAAGRYVRSVYGGPFVQDKRYMEQYLQYPEQVDAINTWSQHQGKLIVPPLTPTPEESQKMAAIMSEINTYVDEMFLKFIMGQEPLDKFADFVAQIERMNISEALEIQNTALDRFNNR